MSGNPPSVGSATSTQPPAQSVANPPTSVPIQGVSATVSAGQVGAGSVIPQPTVPKPTLWGWLSARDERKQIERDEAQSHNIRRIAAYGGMLVVALLYCAGVAAIALFLGLFPNRPAIGADKWHIVVATLVALFTVPTVLAICIMRLTAAPSRKNEIPPTVHEWLAKVAEKILDKVTGD